MHKTDSRVFIVRTEEELGKVYDYAEQQLTHGDLEIEVKPYVPKRSTLQNRLYWEYMTQLADFTGHTKDEMHLFCRWKFIGADKKEVMGQSFNALPSTQDLNTKEFTDYIRSIEVFASEQGFMFKAPPYYEDVWK